MFNQPVNQQPRVLKGFLFIHLTKCSNFCTLRAGVRCSKIVKSTQPTLEAKEARASASYLNLFTAAKAPIKSSQNLDKFSHNRPQIFFSCSVRAPTLINQQGNREIIMRQCCPFRLCLLHKIRQFYVFSRLNFFLFTFLLSKALLQR